MKHHKIVHIVSGRADPNTANGVNKWVHSVATAQQKQGYDVGVWGITKNTHLTKHEHIYPLYLFKPMHFPFGNDKKLIDMLKTIPKNTIFHMHSVFIFEFYIFSRNLKKHGFKWVLTPHGGYTSPKNNLLKFIYKKLFENTLIKEASAIHAISINDIDEISKKKFGIVPNGVQFNPNFKTIYSTDRSLRINYCGRLAISQKGLDLLLKALDLFKKQEKNIHLDLVGDGPDRALLEKMVESLDLTKQVTFYGSKFGTEKDEIIKKSDLFIHCSRWEGMPLAILEAASLAVPLLVSKPTNLADHVYKSGAGFVIDELTPKNISDMLLAVFKEKINGKLDNKGKAARKMAVNNFSWENTTELLSKNVYSKII
jgi:glycosyltransferase involved in cell wall biosynthesis